MSDRNSAWESARQGGLRSDNRFDMDRGDRFDMDNRGSSRFAASNRGARFAGDVGIGQRASRRDGRAARSVSRRIPRQRPGLLPLQFGAGLRDRPRQQSDRPAVRPDRLSEGAVSVREGRPRERAPFLLLGGISTHRALARFPRPPSLEQGRGGGVRWFSRKRTAGGDDPTPTPPWTQGGEVESLRRVFLFRGGETAECASRGMLSRANPAIKPP